MIRVNEFELMYAVGSWRINEITQRTNQQSGEVSEVPITRYTYLTFKGALKHFAELTATKKDINSYIKDYERITNLVLSKAEELDKTLTVKLSKVKPSESVKDE